MNDIYAIPTERETSIQNLWGRNNHTGNNAYTCNTFLGRNVYIVNNAFVIPFWEEMAIHEQYMHTIQHLYVETVLSPPLS